MDQTKSVLEKPGLTQWVLQSTVSVEGNTGARVEMGAG